MKPVVKAGLIGFGVVGTGVVRLMLNDSKPFLKGRGFGLELVKIADIDMERDRGVSLPEGMLTNDAGEILNDPEIDIVIELIGGYEPARAFTLKAFENGKSVVSANKALIARHGSELFAAAEKAGVAYLYEAAVGGGIPILRGLADGLDANTIESIFGILNGTTNYILTGMSRDGFEYRKVLAKAQKLGYAEADPTSDVSGRDALNKIAILARLAFGAVLDMDAVYCEGIENVSIQDILYAEDLGYTIKLLAIAKRHPDNRIEARVHPTLVPSDSIMAYVEDEFNAIEICGDAVGREIFYGKGAGMMPTASAVVSDCVDIAKLNKSGSLCDINRHHAVNDAPTLVDMEKLRLRYYLRFMARDEAGVLAQISRIFADENISIKSVIQISIAEEAYVPIVIMTHEALEGDMRRAMKRFGKLDTVKGRIQLIRVEEV